MGKKILVAEDEPYITESLSFVLNHAGYQVLTESDGAEVVKKIRRLRPDVVILDLMLPNKNGFEILKQLKSDDELKQIPVMVLTAKGQHEDRTTTGQLGADAFITKPFSNREVLASVNQLANQTVNKKASS
ncbi:MAG: response regulator transcription factor [Arenicellales bacterium WSBS_2016_MAG_OTU3]